MKTGLVLGIAVIFGVVAGPAPAQAAFPPPFAGIWTWTGNVGVQFNQIEKDCYYKFEDKLVCTIRKKRFNGKYRLDGPPKVFQGDGTDITSGPNFYEKGRHEIQLSGTYSGSGGEKMGDAPPDGDIGPVPMEAFTTSKFGGRSMAGMSFLYRPGYDVKRGFTGKFLVEYATARIPALSNGVDVVGADFRNAGVELVLNAKGKDGPRRNGLTYRWTGSKTNAYDENLDRSAEAKWTYNLTLAPDPDSRCFKVYKSLESAEKKMKRARKDFNKSSGSAKAAAGKDLKRAAKDAKRARQTMKDVRVC